MADAAGVDRVFSTYRADSVVSRLGRGEIDARRLPARGGRGAGARRAGRSASPAAPSTSAARLRRHAWRLDPSGVVKGWAVERAARSAARRSTTPTSACPAGGDLVCSRRRPGTPGLADRHRGPARPDPAGRAVVPVRDGRRRHLRARPTAAPTSSTPGPVGRRPASPRSPWSARSLTWADIDATAAFALGPDAADWLRTRPGRSGLVVWADGRREVVESAQSDAGSGA